MASNIRDASPVAPKPVKPGPGVPVGSFNRGFVSMDPERQRVVISDRSPAFAPDPARKPGAGEPPAGRKPQGGGR